MSYVRVVRFTGVEADRIQERLDRVQESDGPPEGVSATGIQILHDEDQGTAVVLQFFDSAEDMASSEAALDAMDPSDTPGTRASIDRCEKKLELSA